MTPRTRCRAIFLDAGGVIVLPDRHVLAGALKRAGIMIDRDAVPVAHYRAVRALDRAAATPDYAAALFTQLGIVPARAAEAQRVWDRLTSRRSDPLWRERTPGAMDTIVRLRRAGIAVLVLTNSDGHAEENLAACGFALPVIDSTVVGATKPDPRIFEIALVRAGVRATETVHVGDTLTADIAGAHAAGITPIHFDPLRACRARDHRHIRTLAGVWQHIVLPTTEGPATTAGPS